jgi:hypothetical protein
MTAKPGSAVFPVEMKVGVIVRGEKRPAQRIESTGVCRDWIDAMHFAVRVEKVFAEAATNESCAARDKYFVHFEVD